MKKSYFLFLLVFIVIPDIQAQNICYGDVTLTTQEEVDAFDCEIVKGTLTITGPDIKNIHALSSLTTVGEHFIIGLADSLKDLDGLENLEKVTCSFELKNNFSLQNIEALGNLKRIGRNLTLIDNGVLTSLNGLQQIDSVLNLKLIDNPNLNFCCDLFPLISNGGVYGYTQIEFNGNGCTEQAILNCSFNQTCDQYEPPVGAQNVCIGDVTLTTQDEMNAFDCEYVTGTLTITGNIFSTDSLHQLKGVGENLVIYQSALQSLGGLEKLTDIGCSLIITNTFGLKNIGSLSNLTKVGSKIELRSNPRLTTLPYFEIDSLDELIVTDQPMLKYCCGLKDLIGKVSGNI